MTTWNLEVFARGPEGQSFTVVHHDMPEMPTVESIEKAKAAAFDAFPLFFGCDPEHVEAHIKEEDPDDDPGEAATAV